jgi:peptidoglycan/LPS O-acetylase OafA/YrhL
VGPVAVPRPDAGYVPALDGIRALAVSAVLAFHGGVAWLQGGFLGVDAFFVLSGYLITTLLLREWQRTGGIALAAFWGRRARRLLPALLLVMTVVMVCARSLLPPEEVRLLRGDGLATLLYVANWRMIFRGGDYFAQTAAPSPLQHTWSLGIEEQFYLILPLMLSALLVGRRPLHRLLVVCAAMALASVIAMRVMFSEADPGRAYYGTDTRAASLLIGVALATVCSMLERNGFRPGPGRVRRTVAVLALLGALTTVWAWTSLSGDDSRLYGGGLTVAALAVAAVIAHIALVPGGLSARLLSLPPLPALGRISYGVYLWHWPIFIAANAERTGLQGPRLLALRCLVTLVVAVASYLLVERPIRTSTLLRRRSVGLPATTITAAAAAALVVATTAVPPTAGRVLAGVATDGTDGLDGTGAVDGIDAVTAPRDLPSESPARESPPSEHHRTPGQPIVLDVFGDSVAWSLAAYFPRHPALDVRDRTMLGCGVVRSAPYRYFGQTYPRLLPKCRHWPRLWKRAIATDDPDVALVLVGRWETMDRKLAGRWRHIGDPVFDADLRSELHRAITVAGSQGAQVVLATEPYNRRGEQPDGSLYPEDRPERVTDWNRLLRSVADAHPGVTVVDFGRRVSPEGRYTESAGGVKIRADGLHLTPTGVQEWIAPWLIPRVVATVQP